MTTRSAPTVGSPPAGCAGGASGRLPWLFLAGGVGSASFAFAGWPRLVSSVVGIGMSGAAAQRGMTSSGGWFRWASASSSVAAASAWALAAALARASADFSLASRAALRSSASRSSRAAYASRSVASRRSARGSTRRELEDPPVGPTMEAAGDRS